MPNPTKITYRGTETATAAHPVQIQKVYIERSVANTPQVGIIRDRLKVPFEIIDGLPAVYNQIAEDSDPILSGKRILYLTRNKGAFVKNCPGTPSYQCCGYKILHIGTFCTMDCSYCILQSYFHPPVLQYFVNHEDMFTELDRLYQQDDIVRIGTGEFTDSLIWELWTDLSTRLVPKFAQQRRAVLEIKSKTVAIKRFQHLQHRRKTILSWSLNSETVVRNEERNTASLMSRYQAAKLCESWGYPLAFHFDPLIIYDGWEDGYRRSVEQLFTHVTPQNIAWISLGALRFMPELKPIIQRRFPDSKIVYGELITGLDRKMRYLKPMRIALYRKVVGWIRDFAPDVVIYFCMEDDEVWLKSLGFTPSERGGLPQMLNQSAIRQCQLK